ncbi:MAG: hypothetical protein IPG79_16740 [Saprospiraceae bacterium]|nr:hypothetical protein [Saprospiraceae bacterium]
MFVVPPMKAIIDDDATLRLMNTIPFYNQEHIILSDIKIVKEQFLDKEKNIFHSILEKKTNLVKKEIERYNDDVVNDKKNGIYRPVIQFPERDTSILERGHEYLKNSSYKSGKFITPYVIWAAVNNQYINCKFDVVYYHREKRFF